MCLFALKSNYIKSSIFVFVSFHFRFDFCLIWLIRIAPDSSIERNSTTYSKWWLESTSSKKLNHCFCHMSHLSHVTYSICPSFISWLSHFMIVTFHDCHKSWLSHFMFVKFHVCHISCLIHFMFDTFHVWYISCLIHFMFDTFHVCHISCLSHFMFDTFHVWYISCLWHFMKCHIIISPFILLSFSFQSWPTGSHCGSCGIWSRCEWGKKYILLERIKKVKRSNKVKQGPTRSKRS